MKRKQLHKGLVQLSEEGAVQTFKTHAGRRLHPRCGRRIAV